MQVQLIVANENRKGQVIPVNVPSFMIGRAEGCNLRSNSPQISRHHCTILSNNGTVTVQDLGGENGTFVNGSQISTSQELKDGDKLVVGTHAFVVSIKTGAAKQETHQGETFELPTNAIVPPNQEQSDTRPIAPNKTTAVLSTAKPSKPEAEVTFEIRLDGQRILVPKSKLFELARKGSVLPDDLVTVAGTKVFADSIQGIVFGEQSSASQPSPSAPQHPPTGSAVQPPSPIASAVATPATLESDPFSFANFGGHSGASPFDNLASEPFVQVARKESAFNALWKALDISFSRVYAIEGNNLVIHSIKALYYVLVVVCFLFVFWTMVDFCNDWYNKGVFLEQLQKHYIALASSVFGGVTIIVIVRVLLEMLLLAWIESAQKEHQGTEE